MNKSIIEEILIKYLNTAILLHETFNIKKKKKKGMYSVWFIFDKELLFWFKNIL